MRNKIIVWFCAILMIGSGFVLASNSVNEVGASAVPGNEKAYTSHAPIRIDSNADFPGIASAGDGSEATPWIIEGWDINGTGNSYCIYVGNTTEHYVIRNCTTHHASFFMGSKPGLSLFNTSNGIIYNCEVYDNEGRGIYVVDSNNITIEKSHVYSNDYYESGRGIEMENTGYSIIKNCTLNDNGNDLDGIYMTSGLNNNNKIINNTVLNHSVGIRINNGEYSTITDNHIENGNGYGMYVGACSNSIIENNYLYNISYTSLFLGSSSYLIVRNNTMNQTGMMMIGMEFTSLDNFNTHTIETTNLIDGKPVYYIKNQTGGTVPLGAGEVILANCTGVEVSNQASIIGIEAGFCSQLRLKGNTIPEGPGRGILTGRSDNLTIEENILLEGTIYSSAGFDYIIQNNFVTNAEYAGISSEGIFNSIFRNNNATGNGNRGIYFEGGSGNLIYENELSNQKYGISLSASYWNQVYNNSIVNNSYTGLSIGSNGANNFIYHNNFINNNISHQVVDGGHDNNWDNGYPSGGNYWSDYLGIDNNSTASQDVPPSDGLGDTPYIIAPSIPVNVANETVYGPSTGVELNTTIYSFGNGNITWSYLTLYDGDWMSLKYLWEESDYTLNATTGEFTIDSSWYPFGTGWFLFGNYNYDDYESPIRDNYPLMELWTPESQYTQHLPIRINSNADFNQAHGVVNWATGNGTASNPWIIEGWDVNGTGYGYCIYIGNTTEYFEIRGCYLHDANGSSSPMPFYDANFGLGLYYVDNGNVNDSVIERNGENGIFFFSSDDNQLTNNDIKNNSECGIEMLVSAGITIKNNNITNNSKGINTESGGNKIISHNNISSNSRNGIDISGTGQIIVHNNTFFFNGEHGISLFSQESIIQNNSMLGNSIFVDGPLDFWNSHTIDESNLIDGKPVRYLKNITGGTVPSGAGEVILANCQNITIENQNLYGGSAGILIGHSSNNIIQNNTVSSNSQEGMYLYGSCDNEILNNRLENNGNGVYCFLSCDDNNISQNEIHNNTGYGIYFYLGWRNSLADNTISNNEIHGILLENNFFSTIQNNTLIGNSIYIEGDSTIYWDSHNIDESNSVNGLPVRYLKNQIGVSVPPGAGEVILANCDGITIENHTLNDGSIGILLGYTTNCFIMGNNISSNSQVGMFFHRSSGNKINNNDISNNRGGIHLFTDSSDNSFLQNKFSNNIGYGIRLEVAGSNTFEFNRISNNSYGIWTQVSYGLIANNSIMDNDIGVLCKFPGSLDFYHNNFINNVIQAIDNDTSQWDNGCPSGGNYWSDYSGVDLNSGPAQNVPPSDGIGDTPYSFTGGQDNYPLMEPWGTPSTPTNTYDINLTAGWNLISLPLIPQNTDVADVLSSIDGLYSNVKYYDATDVSDPWKSYSPFRAPSLNDLTNIDHKMGFWILMDNATTLSVEGTEPESTDIMLYAGWNLVGYPTMKSNMADYALLGTSADRVEVCDQAEPSLVKSVDMATYIMQPGEGYWVHVPADTLWTVENAVENPQIVVRGDNPDTGDYDFIWFSDPEPINGDAVTIYATIENLGGGGAEVDVKFYDGEINTSNLIGTECIFIPAVGQEDAIINWTASPGGIHTIIVTAEVNATYAATYNVTDLDPSDNMNSTNLFVTPKILLVDDDNHANDFTPEDTTSFMQAALIASNYTYDFTIIGSGADGPGYDYGTNQMQDYDMVIWMTGYEETDTLTITDCGELEKFLDDGGDFWFISQGFWVEAAVNATLTEFALNYLHVPTMPPQFLSVLPTSVYGNSTHPISFPYASSPLDTITRVGGTENVWSWQYSSIADKSRIGFTNSLNIWVYGISYDSDDNASDSITGSRIFVQTYDFSRITDMSDQAQYAYRTLLWLGNQTVIFGSDVAISQQTINPVITNLTNASVNINAIVRNNGFSDYNSSQGDNLWYLLRIVDDNGTDVIIPELERIDYLGAMVDNEFEIEYNWVPTVTGNFTVIIQVDPYNNIDETNEFNNQAPLNYNEYYVEVLP